MQELASQTTDNWADGLMGKAVLLYGLDYCVYNPSPIPLRPRNIEMRQRISEGMMGTAAHSLLVCVCVTNGACVYLCDRWSSLQ